MRLKNFDFRIWNNDSCKYMDSVGLFSFDTFIDRPPFTGIGEASFNEERNVLIDWRVNAEDYIEIELWTGFYDNDNKRIYEGDILQDEDNKCYIVRFASDIGGFVASLIDYKNIELDSYTLFQLVDNDCKIIGNIHENKELVINNGV